MLQMSTLKHKQVKSQKQHLKILWGRGAEGPRPRADTWSRGLRAEKNKYPKFFYTNFCNVKLDILSNSSTIFRSSHRGGVPYIKPFLKILRYSQKKTCIGVSFLIKSRKYFFACQYKTFRKFRN